jgi:quercetin dioxygenase-like cupin family protein
MTGTNWHSGNVHEEAEEKRGWILGHFIEPADDVRASKDVEVKWGTHPAGQQRPEWTAGDQRTTLILLISGSFRLDLTKGTTTLNRPGDYVVWGPGIDHSWQAETDSVVVTVRWPSLPA